MTNTTIMSVSLSQDNTVALSVLHEARNRKEQGLRTWHTTTVSSPSWSFPTIIPFLLFTTPNKRNILSMVWRIGWVYKNKIHSIHGSQFAKISQGVNMFWCQNQFITTMAYGIQANCALSGAKEAFILLKWIACKYLHFLSRIGKFSMASWIIR